MTSWTMHPFTRPIEHMHSSSICTNDILTYKTARVILLNGRILCQMQPINQISSISNK
uniref:Uncharacterized protein n=1 Tax=Ascaris lumbricoides TaxID=6252 RepID=A0A0M3IAA1_ASCLU